MEPQTPSTPPSRAARWAAIGPWAMAAAGIVLAGIGLAIAADFSTVIRIRLNTVEVAHYTGLDRSSVALLVLGGLALVLLIGAVRGARPAMAAIGLVGLGILLVAVLIDVPHLHDKGVWPQNDVYEDAQATPGIGFYMETAAGILLMLGGAAMLLLAVRPEKPVSRHRAPVGPEDAPEVAAEPVVPEPAPADMPPPTVDPTFALRELPDSLPPEPSKAARFSEPPAKRRSGGIVGRLGRRKH